jgi:hypothetical protein
MASTGNSILARARTIATQMAGDANQSPVIDSKAGLRALLNHSIREVYRQKAKDPKFIKDVNVKNTINITTGSGALPSTVMRQFLKQADYSDANGSLISYFDYAVDNDSGQTFTQLGYVTVQGDTIYYTEPAPGNATSYSGNLYMTVPSFPVLPGSMGSTIPMPDEIVDDVILTLALAIRGQIKFDLNGSIIA